MNTEIINTSFWAKPIPRRDHRCASYRQGCRSLDADARQEKLSLRDITMNVKEIAAAEKECEH